MAELGEHLSAGRLDPHEYADRAATAYSARTADELEVLFVDLPRAGALHRQTPRQPAGPTPWSTPETPYGRDPRTGVPFSGRSRVLAGVLQLVLPIGIGRFYTGHLGIGLAQLLLSLVGVGVIWAFIDGIVILAGHPTDPRGRPLRP